MRYYMSFSPLIYFFQKAKLESLMCCVQPINVPLKLLISLQDLKVWIKIQMFWNVSLWSGQTCRRFVPDSDHRRHQLPAEWPGNLWCHQQMCRPNRGSWCHYSTGQEGTCLFFGTILSKIVKVKKSQMSWTCWLLYNLRICDVCAHVYRLCSMAQRTTPPSLSSHLEPGENTRRLLPFIVWVGTLCQVADGHRPAALHQSANNIVYTCIEFTFRPFSKSILTDPKCT